MKLVVITGPTRSMPQAVAAATLGSALSIAEVKSRLAAPPPVVLGRLPTADAELVAEALTRAGTPALALDGPWLTDGQRIEVRRLGFGPQLRVEPTHGDPFVLDAAALKCGFRGLVLQAALQTTTTVGREFSMARAIVTQGLSVSREVRTLSISAEEKVSQRVVIALRDGRELLLTEKGFDFTCLGPAMGRSAPENMLAIAKLLKQGFPALLWDERLLQLGRRPLVFPINHEPGRPVDPFDFWLAVMVRALG